jgi:hypothetical protein
MRLAYVGLSLALAMYIIAQGVSRPVFFYALVLPVIVFLYGMMAQDVLPEVKVADEEETTDGNED